MKCFSLYKFIIMSHYKRQSCFIINSSSGVNCLFACRFHCGKQRFVIFKNCFIVFTDDFDTCINFVLLVFHGNLRRVQIHVEPNFQK